MKTFQLLLILFLCFSCESTTNNKPRGYIESETPFVVDRDTCQWELNTKRGININIISDRMLSKNTIKKVVDTITKTSFSNYDFIEFYANEIYKDEKYAWYVKHVDEIYESHPILRNRFEFLIDKINLKCDYIKSVLDTKTLNNVNVDIINTDFKIIKDYYKELILLYNDNPDYQTVQYNSQKIKCTNEIPILTKEFNKQKINLK